MATIVHFEIPANDVERARHFYQALFGWMIEPIPDMDYWSITTTGDHPVGGGMMSRRVPEQGVTNYIDVGSVEEHARKVEELGGKVVMPRTAVPGMGYFAVCVDTENNPFGLWQTDENAR